MLLTDSDQWCVSESHSTCKPLKSNELFIYPLVIRGIGSLVPKLRITRAEWADPAQGARKENHEEAKGFLAN